MRDQHGFTLIELIVSLVLLGIIGSMAGFGLVQGMEAYFFSRNTSHTMQKTQFALNRIRLECIHMDSVVAAAADSITYTNRDRDPDAQYTITRANGQITLGVNAGGSQNSYLLLDDLGTYPGGAHLFSYTANDGTSWAVTDNFRDLYSVGIRVILTHQNLAQDFEFQTLVNPRGNGARNAPKAIRHDQ